MSATEPGAQLSLILTAWLRTQPFFAMVVGALLVYLRLRPPPPGGRRPHPQKRVG